MTRIYTRAGDRGETGLRGGRRVSKGDTRIAVLGSVDELNASVGLILAGAAVPPRLREPLTRVQHTLFDAGACLAADPMLGIVAPFERATRELELSIDTFEDELRPLQRFILPGGSPLGAGLHWARAVCRRAEREIVRSATSESVAILAYLNRLSDALFVWARWANAAAASEEIEWIPSEGI